MAANKQRRIRNQALRDFHVESVTGQYKAKVVPNKKAKKLKRQLEKEQANYNE